MGGARLVLVGAFVALGLGLAFYLKAPRSAENAAERIPIGIDADPQSSAVALLPAEPAPAARDEAQLEVAEDAQAVPVPAAIPEADDGAEYVTISVPKAFWESIRARAVIPKPGEGNVVAATGPMVEGVPHGDWEISYTNGSTSRGPYVLGLRNGYWRFVDASGVEQQRGNYQDGRQLGTWEYRQHDGTYDMQNWGPE